MEFSKHLRKSQGSNYYSFNIYLSFDVAFDNVLLCVCVLLWFQADCSLIWGKYFLYSRWFIDESKMEWQSIVSHRFLDWWLHYKWIDFFVALWKICCQKCQWKKWWGIFYLEKLPFYQVVSQCLLCLSLKNLRPKMSKKKVVRNILLLIIAQLRVTSLLKLIAVIKYQLLI